ncbi:unnamed protein product [Linum tenue]|uniref:Protein SLOW GREEN 1, chloroplastic n=1 Tax=Linum tenue TaxID=586396 RepID=A0AAV0R5J9_9ROSI|nr:unnamed protein product [Linum tenue]
MNSTLTTSFLNFKVPSSSSSFNSTSQLPHRLNSTRLAHPQPSSIPTITACLPNPHPPLIIQRLKTLAKTAVLIAASASAAAHFTVLHPAKAEPPAAAEATLAEETPATIEEQLEPQNPAAVELKDEDSSSSSSFASPLSEFLVGNTEAVESLKSLLQQKLESREDEEALKILTRLVAAQPAAVEWKFLMARLYNEMGQSQNARKVFEEILAVNPLSFEALFENALLMDKCGEREAVIARLENALQIAEEENKVKEARDVRLIMAQIQFLQKNVEEAMRIYQELSKEDPKDFRPYFCRGMIYSLLDKDVEAKQQFAKYRELSPKKFEVDGYLRTPLSRMKVFGPSDEN